MQHVLNIQLCMAGDHCGGARKVVSSSPLCDMGREPQRHVNARVTKVDALSPLSHHRPLYAHSASQPRSAAAAEPLPPSDCSYYPYCTYL